MTIIILCKYILQAHKVSYLTFFRNKRLLIDYVTGSQFSININCNLAILMMPQPQNHYFGSHRSQILQFFCRSAAESRPLTPSSTKVTIKGFHKMKKIQYPGREAYILILQGNCLSSNLTQMEKPEQILTRYHV